MTALCGVFGSSDGRRHCYDSLLAQAAYGPGDTFICSAQPITVGACASVSPARQSDHIAELESRWLVACDMRIDNRDELRRALGLSDKRAPLGDAELLLAAWNRWGEDTLDRILGDFAFAVFDHQSRALILTRDPTGQVPLYFRIAQGSAAFASMPSGLRNLGANRSALNPRGIACYLANVEPAFGETCFAAIEAVRPGEMVRIREGAVERRWHWNPVIKPDRPRPQAEMVDEYRQLLSSAVVDRIGSSAVIGAHLSSGYDSSAVASTAAIQMKATENPLWAFTSAPLDVARAESTRHRFADESRLAALTATAHGMRHVVIREADDLATVLERQTPLIQAPLWDPFNMCWWTQIRSRAAEVGIARILTGESGNMTLNAGGLGTLAAYLKHRGVQAWWREARAARRQSNVRWRGIMINSFGSHLPEFAWAPLRALFLKYPATRNSFLKPYWAKEVARHVPKIRPSEDPAADRLAALRRGDLGAYRKASLADRGIAELDPMADRRLIEFSLTLPPESLLRHGISKPLARESLADRVPAEVLNATSRGMQSADWHLKIDPQLARNLLEEAAAHSLFRELVDVAAMEAAIDSWPTEKWNELPALVTYRNALGGALATGAFIRTFDC